jgi:metal-responsive CopG/Arc/MetJ family transcriptional regulator
MNIFVTMPIRITTELAARIDEFWHERRLVSRAAAIRDLLERGLSRPGPRLGGDGGEADRPRDPEHDTDQ